MKNLWSILKFIWSHPLASKNKIAAYGNFFRWQLLQRLYKHPILCPLVENSTLLIEKGMAGATGNLYVGLLEFEDMAFLLHTIQKGDLFADIGANIGVYSVLAAKNAEANVVAIEPIPSTFAHLSNNVHLNKINDLVTLLPVGVSDKNSALYFTNTMDSINHVVPENEIHTRGDGIIKVDVKTIDEIFIHQTPAVIKIDIEGYEWPALNGAKKVLASPDVKAIIIELNGCGKSFGFEDEAIHQLLIQNGFKTYKYDPFKRSLHSLATFGKVNTIYIKDINWVNNRVTKARKFTILGQPV